MKLAAERIGTFHQAQKERACRLILTGKQAGWSGRWNAWCLRPRRHCQLSVNRIDDRYSGKGRRCQRSYSGTPPGKDGKISPAILIAADIAGVNRIFSIGGAQAIAALAFGTESVP